MRSQFVARNSKLRARWQRSIGLDARRHEPGFLGPIPYVLVLRYFVSVAVIFRFLLHKSEYEGLEWHEILLVFGLIAVATISATYVTFFSAAFRRRRVVQVVFILADIFIISAAYGLTRNPESDFFLFYYLPVFAAVEFLDRKTTMVVCCAVIGAIAIVVFSMSPAPKPAWTPSALVGRVLVPRAVFITVVVLSSAFAFKVLSHRWAESRFVLGSLRKSSAAIPHVQELDQELEAVLSELVEKLNFEFAAISLVDEYRNCIETVRGRNISLGWVKRAKHELSDPDIQTHVVKTKETKVIVGWDDLLDREIYERYEHWRMARVWAPIISTDDEVIGTIEAGCDKDRKDQVLTPLVIERVRQLGIEKGEQISRKRPHVLLQGIAEDTIHLIGADSATLHVFRRNLSDSPYEKGQDWGDLILAAGAGLVGHAQIASMKPRIEGRGKIAIREREPQTIDDPQRFQLEYPELYKLGIRALMVVPLRLGGESDGLLGIHFWRPRRITGHDLDLAQMFAREMEGIIYNYLLLRRATEAWSRAWALSDLSGLLQSLRSPFSLPDISNKIVRTAFLTLDAANVILYLYESEKNVFEPPITYGPFWDAAIKEAGDPSDRKLLRLKEYATSDYVIDVQKHPILSATDEGGLPFIDRERIKSCAVLVLRDSEGGELVGLMFVNFRETHYFSAEEKRALDGLTISAASAIRTARLHKVELDAMREVHAAMAEKPDLQQVLTRLLQQALKLTGAKHGVCMQYRKTDETLEAIARWPVLAGSFIEPQTIDQGIIGLAARTGRPILAEDVRNKKERIRIGTDEFCPADFYKEVNPETSCEIAVPLVDEDGVLGVLNLEHPHEGFLTQYNRATLEALALPAIIAFHTVEQFKNTIDLYAQKKRREKHLQALNTIAAYMQRKPYALDTAIRIFLAGVTAKPGFAFSRAMLFLAEDGGGGILRGEAAVGALTREEADRIWDEMEKTKSQSLDDLNLVLQQAEKLADDAREGRAVNDCPLHTRVRGISLNPGKTRGALGECLVTGKCKIVAFEKEDAVRDIVGELTQPNDLLHAIACVPLIGRHKKQIGFLLLDNRFLLKERHIESEDGEDLEAFAGLLALSIENVRLQESLAEEKRVENWKTATKTIAHSVGTALFPVEGNVDKLQEQFSTPGHQTTRGIFNSIYNGIDRAKRILLEFRQFANPVQLELKPVDLRRILTDVFKPGGGNYVIEMDLPFPLAVVADEPKLGDALREILKNAVEEMSKAKDPLLKVKASLQEEPQGRNFVHVEIIDNGPGITWPVIADIFKEGKTAKAMGTGLGLPTAKSIIEKHRGSIDAANCPGGGARFIVRIPANNADVTEPKGEARDQNLGG